MLIEKDCSKTKGTEQTSETVSPCDDSGASSHSKMCEAPEAKAAREEGNEEAFGTAETKAVFWLKLTVLGVLVASAVGVAVAVFYYTSDAEKERFEDRFAGDATKVFEAVGGSLDFSLGAVDSFVVGLVSFARYANLTWPLVTVPDYEAKAAKLRGLSKAFYVGQYLLVTAEQRADWEKYSIENDAWVKEGLEAQKKDTNFHGKMFSDYEADGLIHGNAGPSEGPGPFFPLWQSAPVVPVYPPYNWDGATSTALTSALPQLLEDKQVVISRVNNLPSSDDPDAVAEAEATIDWAKDYIGEDEGDPSEPMSEIFYPIIVDSDKGNDTVVGVYSISIFWRDLINNILPHDSDGIVVVFENACNQTFTYEINGPEVHYLGPGDLHDEKYDYLGLTSALLELNAFSTSDRTYTGLPLSGGGCPYHLHVYPSASMEDDYSTKNPATFTVAAVLIFVFTSGVFLLYDVCVERRQRKVMNTAINSTANVSLLEEKVKERTRKLEISNLRLEEANRRVLSASAAQLQHFACMSHEIRTPLNCIIGLSSLLQDTDLNPMQEESMRMIVNSGDVLLTVVNDVLDYSKLESGNVEIMIQRCNLQVTLNSVVHSIQTQGLSKNLSVRTFYDAAICEFINTDGRRLQQILYNLLGNAIKFSKDGGVVELGISLCSPCASQVGNSYSPEREDSELVKAHGSEDKVLRFEIKDYGKGINTEDFVRIFQPFRQASAETEALYGGSGLGLAIATKLVYRLGGSISVESEEGNWSKFTIDFPFDDTPADIEGISARLKKATIFLVGDEEETAEQVGYMFRQYNVDFARFSNLGELEATIAMKGTLSRDRSYICLVHEDLYDRGIHKVLTSCEHSILLTFGPTYGVKEAQGHFRSLVHMLPSVLMKRLVVYVQEVRKAPRDLVRLDSNIAATIVPYHEFRVLIAEDNLINQKVLSRMLNKLGVTNLTIVDDGEKAVESEAAEAFDVIFMDMQMPRMDGIDACRHIDVRQGGHPKAKVVFVTAQVSQSFKVECRVAGAVGFIAKPCKIRDIENCFQILHAMS